jgi:hypothetical protein
VRFEDGEVFYVRMGKEEKAPQEKFGDKGEILSTAPHKCL